MLPLRVDDLHAELVDEVIVLVQHLALKHPKALDRVRAPAEVHPGLVELELDAPRHQSIDRDVDRHAEVEGEVGPHREAVELAHPLPIDAARGVARERRVGVAIRQHDHAGLERRDDLVEQPVSEVRGVQQAERHRGQRVFFLAGLGRRLGEGGRVPFRDEHAMPFGAQPLRQQAQLRGFPGPVDPFDDEQLAGVLVRLCQVVQHRSARPARKRRGRLRCAGVFRSSARTAPRGAPPTTARARRRLPLAAAAGRRRRGRAAPAR